jgi:hypothetical protein
MDGRQSRFDIEKVQHDRLIGTQKIATGDAEEERIADLAGCAADRDSYGGLDMEFYSDF